jgi:nucleotide-binding universal stress UspA family protein
MKVILVPTDFSPQADNALRYAVELAKHTKASIVLLNVFNIPYPAGLDAPLFILPVDEIKDEYKKQLDLLAEKIRNETGRNIEIRTEVVSGPVSDEIIDMAVIADADLTVMGIKGMGPFGEFLIGSTSTTVAHHTICPLIVVPEKCTYERPERIVLGLDFPENKMAFPPTLLKFSSLFGSKVMAVNIVKSGHLHDEKIAEHKKEFQEIQLPAGTSLEFFENENVIDGILEYALTERAGLIAMTPHRHNFFYDLFVSSHTSKVAFHTQLPLLVLPEKRQS